MADPDKELADIRREVIESRTLVIRADNQLKTLHAEVKTVGRRLDAAIAHQRMASAAAYALFALLAVGAGVVVSVVRGAVAAHGAGDPHPEARRGHLGSGAEQSAGRDRFHREPERGRSLPNARRGLAG